MLESSLRATESLGRLLEDTVLDSGNTFVSPATGKKGPLARQFEEVAKVIQLDTGVLETERSMFYTQLGGWDTHSAMDITAQLTYVDDAVGVLADELKEQGLWNNVAIICVSDFGRTLNSNSRGATTST